MLAETIAVFDVEHENTQTTLSSGVEVERPERQAGRKAEGLARSSMVQAVMCLL
jgi:hypothetical protein